MGVSLVVLLGYTFFTGGIWEDFLITYRFSENLAHGLGLTYNAPERVHGFTSVINTLLPAFFALFAKAGEYMMPLWFYRVISIAAFIAGGCAVVKLLGEAEPKDTRAPWLFTGLLGLSPIVVAYTTNGQEAGFMVLFGALAFVAGYKGLAKHWPVAAAAWTGLLYTRPDTPVLIAAVTVFGLWDLRREIKAELGGMVKAGVATTLAYLPWLIFAWVYYGSPVPHTITAKNTGAAFSFEVVTRVATSVARDTPVMLQGAQMPIYADQGGWAWYWLLSGLIVGLWAGFYWAWAKEDRLGSLASRLTLLMCVYLAFVNARGYAYPWYFAPVILFASIALARSIGALGARHPIMFKLAGAAVVGRMAALLILASMQMQFQQAVIENQVRTPVGMWLKANAKPTDKVYLEPLGYIGYHSGLVMHDWPGLVSPAVVGFKKRDHVDRYQVIPKVDPEWLVLRPVEWMMLQRASGGRVPYRVVQEISQKEQLDANPWLPGRGWLEMDISFLILRRND
jgi:hypothetical protein